MILSEESILQSQDPVPEDLNDWPEFTLKDAQVRIPGSSTCANLLEARPGYPLSVTGKLASLDSQRAKLVKHPGYTRVQLRLDGCTRYAIGQDPSGKSIIWAAGKAGWFEVVPSTRYAAVYDDIVKAIDLIYFLSDAHQDFSSRRPVRGAKVDELLALYQQHTDFRVDEDAEVEALLAKHHTFLIRQMSDGWEGITWAPTYLWRYFSKLYPDEVASDSSVIPESDCEQASDVISGPQAPDVQNLSRVGVSGRGGWTDVIFAEILKLRASGHLDRRRCSVDGITETLFRNYGMSSMSEAEDIVRGVARSLLSRLDADLTPGGDEFWKKRALYRQFQTLADTRACSPSQISSPAVTPTRSHPNQRHRKSILRPSSGAVKGSKRTADIPSPSDEEVESEDDLEEATDCLLDSNTPTKKRRLEQTEASDVQSTHLEDEATPCALGISVISDPEQKQQLDLIRQESMANGRRHINHLEALVEGLMREQHQ